MSVRFRLYTGLMGKDVSSKLINLRVTEETHLRWKAAAVLEGVSLSAWVRGVCDSAAGALTERGASAVVAQTEAAVSVLGLSSRSVSAPVVSTVLGPVAPAPVRFSPESCRRARFHRKGTWCKDCDFAG